MIKVGVLGQGKLGSIIIEALKSGLAPECEFIGAASRSLGVTAMDLADRGAEYIIEASKPAVLKENLIPLLLRGVSVIPLSTGALADAEYLEEVKAAARKGKAKVILPHGAEGAFDLAATYALRPGMKGTIVQYIPKRTPEMGMNPMAVLPESFHGTALEGFHLLPSHLNVVIETAIACGGFENAFYETRIPVDGKGGFALELENDLSKAELKISGKPPKPGTSPMTMIALSAISALNRAVNPITF